MASPERAAEFSVALSGLAFLVCSKTQGLRPGLMSNAAARLSTPSVSARREVFRQFDVRSPRVGEKCHLDLRIGNRLWRHIELDAQGFKSLRKLVEILHLESDVVERSALRRFAPHITPREGHVEPVEVNAIRNPGVRHRFALPGQAAKNFFIPGLNGRNIRPRQLEMDVIHADRPGQGWIAENLDPHSV